jgi:chromosome partitioning protein
MIVTPFGRELKRLRVERGLTVRDLAFRLRKSVGYIGKIEVGGEIPAPSFIADLANALSGEAGVLLGLAKEALRARLEKQIERTYSGVHPITQQNTSSGKGKNMAKRQTATVISLINMKGGVGKTTLAMQLAHAADSADYRVLAVDLDPQSNLSQALMGPRKYVEHLSSQAPTVVQIFDDYVPTKTTSGAPERLDIGNVILKKAGYWGDTSLDLIPSRLELSRTLKNPTGKERRLAKALAQIQDKYDLIIIDCAPTESILTDAAYFASRYVIVPIKPEFMATIGLPLLARSIHEFQLENEDHEISIAGLVFNHSSSYSSGPEGQRSIKEVTDFAKKNHWHVCDNQIRYSASFAKSAREAAPIGRTSYARTDVIVGFRKLAEEIFTVTGIEK